MEEEGKRRKKIKQGGGNAIPAAVACALSQGVPPSADLHQRRLDKEEAAGRKEQENERQAAAAEARKREQQQLWLFQQQQEQQQHLQIQPRLPTPQRQNQAWQQKHHHHHQQQQEQPFIQPPQQSHQPHPHPQQQQPLQSAPSSLLTSSAFPTPVPVALHLPPAQPQAAPTGVHFFAQQPCREA